MEGGEKAGGLLGGRGVGEWLGGGEADGVVGMGDCMLSLGSAAGRPDGGVGSGFFPNGLRIGVIGVRIRCGGVLGGTGGGMISPNGGDVTGSTAAVAAVAVTSDS
jgi:hypothetical protein